MAKQIIILVSVVFFSLTVFTVQTLPQAPNSNRTTRAADAERRRRMTDAERKREAAKRRKERELKAKELAKVGRGPLIDREQKRKELQERAAKIRKEFLREKSALGATEEQWKLIKAKLEKVRHLREQANSMVGLSLAGGSSDTNAPTWQWKRPWKDKAPSELTEAQRLTKQLIALVERRSTTPEAFRRKMAALRKSRSEEAELKRQLAEARRELREILTTRQEAALVLMNRL